MALQRNDMNRNVRDLMSQSPIPPQTSVAEQALEFLTATDEAHARAHAALHAKKERLKLLRAKLFLSATGTVAERQAQADASDEIAAAIDDMENAEVDYLLLDNQRETWIAKFEAWRSLNANMRRST